MTTSFACDPAEMTRLKRQHDTLQGEVDEILSHRRINWDFWLFPPAIASSESDAKARRDTMHEWCDQMSGRYLENIKRRGGGATHWASVIEKDRAYIPCSALPQRQEFCLHADMALRQRQPSAPPSRPRPAAARRRQASAQAIPACSATAPPGTRPSRRPLRTTPMRAASMHAGTYAAVSQK